MNYIAKHDLELLSSPQLKECSVSTLFYIAKRKKSCRTGLTIFNYCFGLFETRSSLYIAQDGLELFLPQPPESYDLPHSTGMAYSQNLNINNYYLNITVLEFTYHYTFKIC